MQNLAIQFEDYHIEETERKGFGGILYRAFRASENAGRGRRDLLFKATSQFGADINGVDLVRDLLVRSTGVSHSGLFSPVRSHFANGELVLVSEWAPSVTLADLIASLAGAKEPWPVPAALHIASEIARTLHHLHYRPGSEQGLVHGFLRPDSIFITFDGQVKLLSLGMAAVERYSLKSRQGHVDDSPNYASPEEAAGREIDGRSDFFSLGAILWELLAGRPLYPASDRKEWARVLNEKSVPPPSQLNAAVPAELDSVIARLTDRDEHLRYESSERAALDMEAVRKYRFPDFSANDFVAFCRGRTVPYRDRYKAYLDASEPAPETTKSLDTSALAASASAPTKTMITGERTSSDGAMPAAAPATLIEPETFKITVEPRQSARNAPAAATSAAAHRYRIMSDTELLFSLPPSNVLKPIAAAGAALLLVMAFFGHSWLKSSRASRAVAAEHHRAVSKLMGSLRFLPPDESFELHVNGKPVRVEEGYAQVPANVDLTVVAKKNGYEDIETVTAVMTDEVLDVNLDFRKAPEKTAEKDTDKD